MIAIFGSGFGLYGYLPALVDGCARRVLLPARYRSRYISRPELQQFEHFIEWKKDEVDVLKSASGLIVALRPNDQSAFINKFLSYQNIDYILLEKPLAATPDAASRIFDELQHNNKIFRIAYTFRFTDWGKELRRDLLSMSVNGVLEIDWSFLANHYRFDINNWKRFNSTGGGAIRFYGIHVIALLSELGYRNVSSSQTVGVSPNEIEKWSASFSGPGVPPCIVVVNTKSPTETFRVEYSMGSHGSAINRCYANCSSPFDAKEMRGEFDHIDRRIPVLIQLCQSLWDNDSAIYEHYSMALAIWRRVEIVDQFIKL